jgi:hypothetical protein
VPKEARDDLEFVLADRVEQVIEAALSNSKKKLSASSRTRKRSRTRGKP